MCSFFKIITFVSGLLCLCRSLCDVKQHGGTRYFRVCLHKDAGNYRSWIFQVLPLRRAPPPPPHPLLRLSAWITNKSNSCPPCPSAAVVWEAGFPRRRASSFVQPALGSGERWTHQPPDGGRLRPGPLHAHPGTASTTPLSDPAPPPAAGRTGSGHCCFSTFVGAGRSHTCSSGQ